MTHNYNSKSFSSVLNFVEVRWYSWNTLQFLPWCLFVIQQNWTLIALNGKNVLSEYQMEVYKEMFRDTDSKLQRIIDILAEQEQFLKKQDEVQYSRKVATLLKSSGCISASNFAIFPSGARNLFYQKIQMCKFINRCWEDLRSTFFMNRSSLLSYVFLENCQLKPWFNDNYRKFFKISYGGEQDLFLNNVDLFFLGALMNKNLPTFGLSDFHGSPV